jgi:hypothetical protein
MCIFTGIKKDKKILALLGPSFFLSGNSYLAGEQAPDGRGLPELKHRECSTHGDPLLTEAHFSTHELLLGNEGVSQVANTPV